MAAPSYTTDLTEINACDSNTTPTAWTNIGTGADATETDYFIHNGACISKPFNITAGGLYTDYGSNLTFASGECYWLWCWFGAPNALLAEASGGYRALVGSSAGNYELWNVMGSDTNPYGGWRCVPVDIVNVTRDGVTGAPTGNYRIFGCYCNTSVTIGKGNPLGIDVIRKGRGELRINGGEVADYATIAGAAAANDNATTARWGLCQAQDGTYLIQGLMILGYTSAVDFRDSNRALIVANTKKVQNTFNKIEVRNASSRVDWTNYNVTALGTVSRGNFEVVDNADVNLDTCVFTDMGTFIFLSASTILGSTFRRCNLVTTGGATFTGCTFDRTNDATRAVTASSPANAALITDSTFVSGGTKHGLEITGTAANMTLTNNTWTGYAGSDGSTGNEAVYVNIATGSMNLTISGGTTPSVRTAGCAVTVVSGAVSATATVTTATGTPIQSAVVMVKAANGTGPFPFEESVTIANSGTTATVTHTAHGLATNDKVLIQGASHLANNGIFSITVTGTGTYTYTMGSAPGSNPTGTIVSTFIVLSGTTDVNGQITMSRVFASDQPVVGWARKSSGSPYYKTGPINGTVDSVSGATLSAVLVLDE